jgi:predicted small secreted protein
MKARLMSYAAAGLAVMLLSSCSTAQGVQNMANRVAQAVGRTARLGN